MSNENYKFDCKNDKIFFTGGGVTMEWTKKVEVAGKEREKILRRAAETIDKWKLKMQDVFPPIVLDFGLNNFSKTGHIEYWIANEEKEKYCGKFIFMFEEQTCPAHYHKKKHETFMVVKGEITMHLASKDIEMKQGDVLPMPQNTLHGFTATEDSLILEISLPSIKKDSFFKDKKIGVF